MIKDIIILNLLFLFLVNIIILDIAIVFLWRRYRRYNIENINHKITTLLYEFNQIAQANINILEEKIKEVKNLTKNNTHKKEDEDKKNNKHQQIYNLYKAGATMEQLAKEFNISLSELRLILKLKEDEELKNDKNK